MALVAAWRRRLRSSTQAAAAQHSAATIATLAPVMTSTEGRDPSVSWTLAESCPPSWPVTRAHLRAGAASMERRPGATPRLAANPGAAALTSRRVNCARTAATAVADAAALALLVSLTGSEMVTSTRAGAAAAAGAAERSVEGSSMAAASSEARSDAFKVPVGGGPACR